MIRLLKKCLTISMLLCVAAYCACAETAELAFGYEIELPEGTVLTQEEWTPENRALMYLLSGTYQNGQEKFRLRINYGFEHQLETESEFAESTNLSIKDIWLWLETSTNLSQEVSLGRKNGGKLKEQVLDQLHEIGNVAIYCITNNVKWTTPSKRTENAVKKYNKEQTLAFHHTIKIPAEITISEEEWMPDSNDIVYRITGNYEDAAKSFNGVIFRSDDNLVNADKAMRLIEDDASETFGWIKGAYGIAAGFSWPMNEESKATADQIIEKFLDEYIALQSTMQFKDTSADIAAEHKNLPKDSDIFYGGYMPSGDFKKSETIPVADGRYTVNLVKEEDVGVLHHQFMEIDEGNVNGLYHVALNDNGHIVNQYTTYQYLLLPEDFPKDIEYMPDKEYLDMLERALNILGEEKAVLLRDLLVEDFNLKNPEIITNEEMKANHTVLQEQISNLSAGGWHNPGYNSNLIKKEQAIRLCQYWEIFDETQGYHRDYLVDGIRWLEVNGALIGGYMGGIGHCAIFDGALHFVRGNFDLRSITRVEDWKSSEAIEITQDYSAPDNGDQNIETASEKKHRVVNTKSSPLTLRETPNNNGAKILSIPKGEKVLVIEDSDWPLVEYNGKQGYVNGKYLK